MFIRSIDCIFGGSQESMLFIRIIKKFRFCLYIVRNSSNTTVQHRKLRYFIPVIEKRGFQNFQKSHPYADLVSEDANKNGPEDFDPVVKISNPHHSLTKGNKKFTQPGMILKLFFI